MDISTSDDAILKHFGRFCLFMKGVIILRKPTATCFKMEKQLKLLYYHFKTPLVHYVHSWVFKSDNTLVLVISSLFNKLIYPIALCY